MVMKQIVDTTKGYSWLSRCSFHKRIHLPPPERPHLLLLAWFFPPQITGGTYRPAALARYARRAGWDVTVIAAPANKAVSDAGRAMLNYVGDAVEVHRVQPPSLSPSYRFFPRIDGGMLNALAVTDLAVSKLECKPSVILATGPAFHTFLAAKFLARILGSRYVLEYRDEWSLCPFDFVEQSKTNRFVEAYCLSGAGGLVFTTKSQLDLHEREFKQRPRCHPVVVPNGWEPNDADDRPSAISLDPTKTNIGFLGNLAGHSLPDRFLAQLAAAIDKSGSLTENLRIYFVGQKNADARAALEKFPYPDMLVLIDQIKKSDALTMMRSLDGLLLINQEELWRYRPGKLYDYLCAETPIIVFGAGGEVAELVNELEAGIIIDDTDTDALLTAINTISSNEERDPQRLHLYLAKHTREATSMDLLSYLADVSKS